MRAPRRPVQTLLSQCDGRRRPTSEGDRNRGGRLGPASARGPGGGGLRHRSPSGPGPPSSRLAAGVHPTVTVAGEPARRGTARPLRVHLTRPTVQMNLQSSVWSWLLNQGLHRRGEVPGTGRGGGDRVCSGPSPCGTPSSSSVWRQARTTNSARATLRRPPRGPLLIPLLPHLPTARWRGRVYAGGRRRRGCCWFSDSEAGNPSSRARGHLAFSFRFGASVPGSRWEEEGVAGGEPNTHVSEFRCRAEPAGPRRTLWGVGPTTHRGEARRPRGFWLHGEFPEPRSPCFLPPGHVP